jgi:hypothetical protein
MSEPLIKPEQQVMDHAQILQEMNNSFLVKQTMRGCLQECMGCEATSEYEISKMDWAYLGSGTVLQEGWESEANRMYALEQSSLLQRLCWKDGRSMSISVSEWQKDKDGKPCAGAKIVEFKKPCGCPTICRITIPDKDGEGSTQIQCPCCCMLPKVTGVMPDGREIGTSQYICDNVCCVPKFHYKEHNELVYVIAPPTCCGGCCISCERGYGKGCCKVPFYFMEPDGHTRVKDSAGRDAQISKVWAGLKKECCSSADTFAVFLPEECQKNPDRAIGMLGLTFLLDFTVFENQGSAAQVSEN